MHFHFATSSFFDYSNALKNFQIRFVSCQHAQYLQRTLDLFYTIREFRRDWMRRKQTPNETNARLRNEKPPCTDERLNSWSRSDRYVISNCATLSENGLLSCRVVGMRSHIGTGRHSVEYVVVRVRLEVRNEENTRVGPYIETSRIHTVKFIILRYYNGKFVFSFLVALRKKFMEITCNDLGRNAEWFAHERHGKILQGKFIGNWQ